MDMQSRNIIGSNKAGSRAERTVTRMDLANVVYGVVGTTRSEAAAIVDAIFEKMFDTICKGETVKLHNFGKFVIRHKDKREGRNPRTLEPAEISERQIVQFKASPAMKGKLNVAAADKPVKAKKKKRVPEDADC